jgi:hypothetical protein
MRTFATAARQCFSFVDRGGVQATVVPQSSASVMAGAYCPMFMALALGLLLPNEKVEQLAANNLTIPQDAIASLLQRLVSRLLYPRQYRDE